MRFVRLVILLALLAPYAVTAQERIVLDQPVFSDEGVRSVKIWVLSMRKRIGNHPINEAQVMAIFRATDEDGEFILEDDRRVVCAYNGEQAEAIIAILNQADLSEMSLERRVIARCQQDGFLGSGTVVEGSEQQPGGN